MNGINSICEIDFINEVRFDAPMLIFVTKSGDEISVNALSLICGDCAYFECGDIIAGEGWCTLRDEVCEYDKCDQCDDWLQVENG